MHAPATLHLLCGKPAAGKSTLADALARAPRTVLISEDAWLAALFGPEMTTLKDYVRLSARLRTAMDPHVTALLASGTSVVLDFPANTRETRGWMRDLLDASGSDHLLHWLDLPDSVCRARIEARNATGEHPFAITEAQFDRIASHFEPPTEAEGFTIRRHAEP